MRVSHSEIERELALNAVGWTRVELDVLWLTDGGDASRAAAALAAGAVLSEVAADHGAARSYMSTCIAEADTWLQPALRAAQPAEVLGPLAARGAFAVVLVRGRTPPMSTDQEVRRRAEAGIVRRWRTPA
jgi:hypothetical protein